MRTYYHASKINEASRLWRFASIVSVCLVTSISATASELSPSDYSAQVQPILKQHCYSCHGPQKSKGDLRLDTINPDMINGIHGEVWHDVLHNIQRGEMPPEDKPQLSSAERTILINWLQASFKHAAEKRKPTGQLTLRRLTREEYANTMRDLIGIDLDYASSLPSEPLSPDGFTNNGASMGFSGMQLETILETARMALGKAIVEGSQPKSIQAKPTKDAFTLAKINKGDVGPRIKFSSSAFVTSVKEYQREGDFTITAKIEAVIPPGAAAARLQVRLGFLGGAGTGFAFTAIGESDITTSGTHDLSWSGRMERVTLPDVNAKNKSLHLSINHLPENGSFFEYLPVPGNKMRIREGNRDAPGDPKKDAHVFIHEVTFSSPSTTIWPPAHHRNIYFDRPSSMSDEQYAHAVIKRFTEKAFRRAVTDADLSPIVGYYKEVLQKTKSDITAMREALAMVLVSPDFLYLLQPSPSKAAPRPLTSEELASRLSYFLWGTLPDEALTTAARKNLLTTTSEIANQTRRLLKDKKSSYFTNTFVNQWLDLDGLDRIAINPSYYPEFKDAMKGYMREETQLLFSDTLHNNLNALTLLSANYSFLNKPLADHYGISGPKGLQYQRVNLKPQDKRGGLLTHASIHLVGSTGEQSHPILRAKWVRDRLLNDPPLPPPPNVEPLDEESVDFSKLTLKQQLEQHRKKESCFDCHKNLDPWGLPFEHYDAVGQWRDQVKHLIAHEEKPEQQGKKKGKKEPEAEFALAKIDDTAVLPGNKQIAGLEGLRQHLLSHERDRFTENIVHRLTTYAIGRSLTFSDQPMLNALYKQFAEDDYRLGNLITAITTSKLFTHQ